MEKGQNKAQDSGQLLKIRQEKLQNLREAGKDPFLITTYDADHHSMDIKEDFDQLENQTVRIAGRIMLKRVMGKASFCHIQDLKGSIQIYLTRDDLGEEEYAEFKKYDVGDIVGVEGFVFRTQKGEISVHVKKLTLLSKSLQILPEKFHGLTDTDMRYRQRYVDLIMNEESKDTFIKRSKMIASIRRFMDDKGFIEVETPILVAIPGGAAARPFETYSNALGEDFKLRISLELYLKRLIVGGLERVYEIGRVFRNEGVDTRHNPEFTLMELYQAYTDYKGMMDLTEELYRYLAREVTGSEMITYGDKQLDFSKPFPRLSMVDAVKKYANVDFDAIATDEEAKALAKEHHLEFEKHHTKGNILNIFFEEYVEDHLIQPTFIIDHPIEISPLTKKNPDKPGYVERFELFINGWEMANAYSELNDPIDQRERFEAQEANFAAGDEEAEHLDEDFLNALSIGMPPTGGIGYGIDRLAMLLTNSPAIRDVLLFPTMKTLGKQAAQGEQKSASKESAGAKEDPHKPTISREKALELLKQYNKEDFHMQHAYTVEGVMRYFARQKGYNEEFWGMVGLLHDIDFEMYPEEHCIKAPELLKEGGVGEDMIRAIICHGYGLTGVEEAPEHEMEKILYATDELTGLIWACALMRPSKSTKDLELKSLKKKYKSKGFAAGVDRSVIENGAKMLGIELDELLEQTILAMRDCEDDVAKAMQEI